MYYLSLIYTSNHLKKVLFLKQISSCDVSYNKQINPKPLNYEILYTSTDDVSVFIHGRSVVPSFLDTEPTDAAEAAVAARAGYSLMTSTTEYEGFNNISNTEWINLSLNFFTLTLTGPVHVVMTCIGHFLMRCDEKGLIMLILQEIFDTFACKQRLN